MPTVTPPKPVGKIVQAHSHGLILPTKRTKVAHDPKDHILLFYGPPGVGKTTLVNNLGESVLFLSTDRGTRFLEATRIDCLNWKKFEDVVAALEKPGAPRYDIICIDHVDDWANMCEENVCAALKIDGLGDAGFGKGWKAYRNGIGVFVRRIMRLGSGVVFIAHEDTKNVKVAGREVNKVQPGLSKSAWKVIIPLADIVGYIGFKTLTVKDATDPAGKRTVRKEVRVLETQPREDLYAKDRTDRVKPEKGWTLLDPQKFIESFANVGK